MDAAAGVPPSVTLEFDITQEDLLAYHRFHLWGDAIQRTASLRRYLILLGLAFGGCIVEALAVGDLGSRPFWVASVLTVAVAAAVGPLGLVLMPLSMARRSAAEGVLGPYRIKLSKEGLAQEGPQGMARVAWPLAGRLASGADYAFLYWRTSTAFILPRRALRSLSFSSVEQAVEHYRAQATVVAGDPTAERPAACGVPARVTSVMTEADVLAFGRHHILRGLRTRPLLPAACVVFLLATALTGAAPTEILAPFVLLVLLFAAAPYLAVWQARRIPGAFGMATVELTEDGVHALIPPEGEVTMPWSQIPRIESSRDHVFLYLNRNHALVIRASAFANEEARRAFMGIAGEKIAAAKAGAP